MIMVSRSREAVERQIEDGEFKCPRDGASLRKWGYTRSREVRGLVGAVRPRRLRCPDCGSTRVLLPNVLLLRRWYSAAVIGEVFRLSAQGLGFRRIGRRLGIPQSTVRRWLREARRNLAAVVAVATAAIGEWDPGAPAAAMRPPGVAGMLVDVCGRLSMAARVRYSDGGKVAPWSLLSQATGGLLLHPGMLARTQHQLASMRGGFGRAG
jgi:transposase-like protein